MAEFSDSISIEASDRREQVEAFEQHGKQLFAGAQKKFNLRGTGGVGSTNAKVLDHARYHAKEGELITVSDSAAAIGFDESVGGSISVTIETSLPWSLDFPNAFIREKFDFTAIAQSEGYEYSLGVNEYTIEGEPAVMGHTIDDMRHAYPDEMAPFQLECTPEHFTDQLLTVVQVKPENEVGCEPNPYYLVIS